MKLNIKILSILLVITSCATLLYAKSSKKVIDSSVQCTSNDCKKMAMLSRNLNIAKEAYLKKSKTPTPSKEEFKWDIQQSKIASYICGYKYRIAGDRQNKTFLKFVSSSYEVMGHSMSSSEAAQCFYLIYRSNKNPVDQLVKSELRLLESLQNINNDGSPVKGGDVQ